jgi:hypothetical protein
MEFVSAITGFIELYSRAQSRGQERAPIQISLYVAGRRVKVVSPHSRTAPPLTRRPAPGLLRLGFGAWRIASDKNKPAAPDVLKVVSVKNFSTPAKFGILPGVSKNN